MQILQRAESEELLTIEDLEEGATGLVRMLGRSIARRTPGRRPGAEELELLQCALSSALFVRVRVPPAPG
jgi:hypothetical protein